VWPFFFLEDSMHALQKMVRMRCKCSTGTFARVHLSLGFHKGERSCSFPLEKLSLFSPPSPRAESIAQGVSPSADGDKGYSPLTSTAFFEKKAAQKNFYNRVRSNGYYPPSPVGGSVSKNPPVNEAVGGVDDPTARWQRYVGRELFYKKD
jgi:hypothetical protein